MEETTPEQEDSCTHSYVMANPADRLRERMDFMVSSMLQSPQFLADAGNVAVEGKLPQVLALAAYGFLHAIDAVVAKANTEA